MNKPTHRLLVQDHAHGGGYIDVRDTLIRARSQAQAIRKLIAFMGDYPVGHLIRA